MDAAVEPGATGLARSQLHDDELTVLEASTGTRQRPPTVVIAEWLEASATPTLVAVDAPLGWPDALRSLGAHDAGEALAHDAHSMFRRSTDQIVRKETGQQSLDVGADRIARTAHAALALLTKVRRLTGLPLLLAWTNAGINSPAVIEVYPAASLRVWGVRNRRYKKREDMDARSEIVSALGIRFADDLLRQAVISNADMLDATLCCLSGTDFLKGRCKAPAEPELARREGWIWVAAASAP